jgi:hypothetical protein
MWLGYIETMQRRWGLPEPHSRPVQFYHEEGGRSDTRKVKAACINASHPHPFHFYPEEGGRMYLRDIGIHWATTRCHNPEDHILK